MAGLSAQWAATQRSSLFPTTSCGSALGSLPCSGAPSWPTSRCSTPTSGSGTARWCTPPCPTARTSSGGKARAGRSGTSSPPGRPSSYSTTTEPTPAPATPTATTTRRWCGRRRSASAAQGSSATAATPTASASTIPTATSSAEGLTELWLQLPFYLSVFDDMTLFHVLLVVEEVRNSSWVDFTVSENQQRWLQFQLVPQVVASGWFRWNYCPKIHPKLTLKYYNEEDISPMIASITLRCHLYEEEMSVLLFLDISFLSKFAFLAFPEGLKRSLWDFKWSNPERFYLHLREAAQGDQHKHLPSSPLPLRLLFDGRRVCRFPSGNGSGTAQRWNESHASDRYPILAPSTRDSSIMWGPHYGTNNTK